MASIAEDAKKYDPHGCSLPLEKARTFWRVSNFIDGNGVVQMAYQIHFTNGILSVEFADGSILSMPQWQS